MTLRALHHLRFPAEQSRGRRYPELPHPWRNDFQRDRDRVVHARAFRRLENKTQVFTPGLHDHFRNRLTHTIEVGQIARTLSSALGLNDDLTEALSLAHDIGHPPFAHSGEEELDRRMQRFGDRFDHNLQSLRIVESLEQRYARFPGLNLTFEVREGIAKHSRDFERGEYPELDEYLPGLRPPLEAQLIDLADEIAYNTADLDDGFSARLYTAERIVEEVPFYEDIYDTVETQFGGAEPHVRFHESLRILIDWLVTGLIEGTLAAVKDAGVETVDDIRRHPVRLIRFTPESRETNLALKQFLRSNVYNTEPLVAERRESAGDVGELFEYLLANPDRMPVSFRDSGTPVHRAVCDYISGMTDSYFRRIYDELLGHASESRVR